MDAFKQAFAGINGTNLRHEDRDKAAALVTVVGKSTASLSDAVALAEALGLNLHLVASSKPEPKEEPSKEEA